MRMITIIDKMFDEEVDYKKLYEDLLCLYRELEFKYKSLEETSMDLEEKLRSLEQSISGKNKKIGGIKSALSRIKKSNTAVLPNDVSNANLGTEVIVKHTTLASKSVQIFSGYEIQRDNNTSDFKNIRGRHKCMVYCRLGEESCGPITTLTSAKQKKRAEFAVDLCEIVAAGNKIDCTDEERITLFIKYFKSYPGIFETISRHLNKTICSPLTPTQSVQLQSLLRITTFKFRLLRVFFSNLNIKLFSSEGKMRKVMGNYFRM